MRPSLARALACSAAASLILAGCGGGGDAADDAAPESEAAAGADGSAPVEVTLIDYAFEVLGVHRLEARAAVLNGRGNNALRKLGAVQEALLRKSLDRSGDYLDQVLWSIVADDWRSLRPVTDLRVH